MTNPSAPDAPAQPIQAMVGGVLRTFTTNDDLLAALQADQADQERGMLDPVRAFGDMLDELNEALRVGAFFNPEQFGAMLRPGDNPILRWRDALVAERAAHAAELAGRSTAHQDGFRDGMLWLARVLRINDVDAGDAPREYAAFLADKALDSGGDE